MKEVGDSLHFGAVNISASITSSVLLSMLLALVAWLSTRKLELIGSQWQSALEGIVLTMKSAIEEVLPGEGEELLPFIGTLWLFILCANLLGLVPGLSSPTSELSVTAALAFLVFLSVHWYGIKQNGIKSYLRHYLTPSPFLLPFHIISEISRTLALAVRLFGNIMSLETAIALVVMIGAFLAPVPLMMLHLIEAIIQAYIFGMLALVYIGSAVQTQRKAQRKRGKLKEK